MSDLHHRFSDVFQRGGTTADWSWRIGEREHYWGFSFRPLQANEGGVMIINHRIASDNELVHTDFWSIRVTSGNNYRFSAIWVVG